MIVKVWLTEDKSEYVTLDGALVYPGLALVKRGKLYDLIHVASGRSAVPWQIRHLITTKPRASAWADLLQEFIDFGAKPLVLPPYSLTKQLWEEFSGAILHSR
jgi:hypothetical protein